MAPLLILNVRRAADGLTITRFPHAGMTAVYEALTDIMDREGYGDGTWFIPGSDENADGWDQIVIRATGEVFGWCDSGVYDASKPLAEVHPRADRLVSPEELRRAA